ncbi:hypothetical protein [Rhizobium sp. CF080]|uniref:hypothetical protein n=1 Tax=Rhizobium sp. (strain CF080) TaxID=1144310 RepID=UPI0012DCF0EE|nr:hypothetical protein [Rhizobium sp. CF080]
MAAVNACLSRGLQGPCPMKTLGCVQSNFNHVGILSLPEEHAVLFHPKAEAPHVA